MRAIIVGAGIAGLVTARQLGLAGWEVDVVEQSPGPRTAGYMMDFFGPGVQASERIGLYPRLAAVAYPVEAAEYVDTAGRRTSRLDYERFSRAAGGNVLTLLRPDMERAAREALGDVEPGLVRLHYGVRPTGIHDDGDDGAAVELEGTGPDSPVRFEADVLIGADGIHSAVRAELFGPEERYLRPLGMRAAAYIVEEPSLAARLGRRFLLTDTLNRTVGLYGLRTEEVAAFMVYREDGTDDSGDAPTRLRRRFAGLGSAVDRMLELCPQDPYDDVVAQVVLPSWHRDRAVLVGDACGAVSLVAGQGGSLAIAGGALLGDLLGEVSAPERIPAALTRFETEWRPVIEDAQAAGRRAIWTFLPATARQRLVRRLVLRAAALPLINQLVARRIVKSIAS
ncbi:FAD-dependent monooxygenase [Arthrobacter sp. JSM 101049]|uniref:FAD-dependent monooxygenase n=1 Tax=Arthrobacter sp. JSM 101049 TaxID=929097 RepID=UPI003563CCD3